MTTKPNMLEAVLRGGQTATHTLEMTRETIQKSIIWTVLPILLVDMFLISRNMPSAAMGALMQKVEAGICQSVGFPLPQQIGITYPNGAVITLPVQKIAQDPYISFESKIATDQLLRGLWFALCMTGLAACGLWFYYKHVGNKKLQTRKIRGQTVTTAPKLVAAIEEYNELERDKRNAHHIPDVKIGHVPYPFMTERNHTIISGTTGKGKTVLICSLLDTIRERGDKAIILDFENTYVKRYYNKKTDIILNPLDERTAHWDPFLDAKTPEDWSTLAASIFKAPNSDDPYWVESARSIFQWTAIVLSQKPETANVETLLKFLFADAAQLKSLLKGTPAYSHFSSGDGQSNRVDSLKSVIANEVSPLILLTGVQSTFSLRDWIVPAEEVAAAKLKAEARTKRAEEALRQEQELKAAAPPASPSALVTQWRAFQTAAKALPGDIKTSLSDFWSDFISAPGTWVPDAKRAFHRRFNATQESPPASQHPLEDVKQGGFLFLTAPEDQLDALRKLLSFWCELAVITLLSRPEDPDQRCVWLIFDEFPTLPKIEKVAEGPQRLRKHGGCMVLGFQQLSQISERYGIEKARTIMGMCQTQIALGAADPETAEFLSKQFGRVQVRTTEENISYGAHSMRDGVNVVAKEEMTPILLPEEFLNMPMLHGVIRVANVRKEVDGGAFPIAPILIDVKNYPDIAVDCVPTTRNALKQFLATVHGKDGEPSPPATSESQAVGPVQSNVQTSETYIPSRGSRPTNAETKAGTQRPSASAANDTTPDGRPEEELPKTAANDTDTTAEVDRQTDLVAAAEDFGTEQGEEASKKKKAAADEANLQMVRDADNRQIVALEANLRRDNPVIDAENMLGVQGEGTLEHSTIAEIKYAQLHSSDGFKLLAEVALSGILGGEVNLGKAADKNDTSDVAGALATPSSEAATPQTSLEAQNVTASPGPERALQTPPSDDFLHPTARDDRDDRHLHSGHTHEQHVARDKAAADEAAATGETAKARTRTIEQQQQDYDRDR